jgi:hypothetical protein
MGVKFHYGMAAMVSHTGQGGNDRDAALVVERRQLAKRVARPRSSKSKAGIVFETGLKSYVS